MSCIQRLPIRKNILVLIWVLVFTGFTYGCFRSLFYYDRSYEVSNWLFEISGTFGFLFALVLLSVCLCLFILACTAVLISLDTALVSLGGEVGPELRSKREVQSLLPSTGSVEDTDVDREMSSILPGSNQTTPVVGGTERRRRY